VEGVGTVAFTRQVLNEQSVICVELTGNGFTIYATHTKHASQPAPGELAGAYSPAYMELPGGGDDSYQLVVGFSQDWTLVGGMALPGPIEPRISTSVNVTYVSCSMRHNPPCAPTLNRIEPITDTALWCAGQEHRRLEVRHPSVQGKGAQTSQG
jgi:hypothetical protein